ncbi:nucleolar MIF4G domain-containing protein 1 isoform X1 [Rhodamnia argentea]|uniref:Nucleolar MIF4G domain-containing protein 1 isoform X1 n=1 Tax=Rhodamnia argentea TaxID=178133 RepID=A0A8B8N1H2_9MYRT|nr:nucleolar MIF4G domain-containing protein 1 isoform X1 [Rhodamnia argentea]
MEREPPAKSRREKRKEARSAKKDLKHQSWMRHQKSRKLKTNLVGSKWNNGEKSKYAPSHGMVAVGNFRSSSDNRKTLKLENHNVLTDPKVKFEFSLKDNSVKSSKVKNNVKRKSKTKFEEYLEHDMRKASISAEEDLELERKLAKKLKVKDGKLRGSDDQMNILFRGMPSILDSFEQETCERFEGKSSGEESERSNLEHIQDDGKVVHVKAGACDSVEPSSAEVDLKDFLAEAPTRKKKKKSKKTKEEESDFSIRKTETSAGEVAGEADPVNPTSSEGKAKYIAPHLRSRAGSESEEHMQLRRRIRGLLNRLSESNVESITGEIATLYSSVGRTAGSNIITEEVLASCSGGPRGNEQYAAVFASFVAGMTCLVGIDFSAKLLASLAKYFENEFLKADNLSLRNLTLLLSYLYVFGVCSSDLIYDFLITLSKRLTEIDVSTILTTLQCCGMKIRGDDPGAMKSFIISVQNRVNQLKAFPDDDEKNTNSKRMEFMLDTICDIKNNKKRTKEDPAPHARIKKWLQKLGMENVLLRGIKWSKLLDPDKKGQWWLSGDMASKTDDVVEVANTIDKEVVETQKMLQLASAQRMNTDARKAIFCIIMSGEDYIDAFEKILRLDLPGKQDREIMRVLVECCLQEKAFNKYYTVLAAKLCEHDKNHKFTLQFCLWDHFKELESMQLLRSMHLAKFVAEMVASFTLSLSLLKTVDFSDARQLTPKRVIHFRMLFEVMFEQPDSLIWNAFTRVAVSPELETLRFGIEFFIREYVVSSNKAHSGKFKIVKRALNNVEGILM